MTHGSKAAVSGNGSMQWLMKLIKTELLNYNEIEKLALEHKPKLIIGGSAYSRVIDFKKLEKYLIKLVPTLW